MSKLYERLKKSIIELGEVERGLREPSRDFYYEVDRSQIPPPIKTWAVCVETDDEKLLVPGKLYEVEITKNRVLVCDEEDEATLCPTAFFMPVELPAEIVAKLSEIEKAA